MAWLAIDEFEDECILDPKPSKNKKLIGRNLTYDDKPVELKEE